LGAKIQRQKMMGFMLRASAIVSLNLIFFSKCKKIKTPKNAHATYFIGVP
jgi:hypothetical protein